MSGKFDKMTTTTKTFHCLNTDISPAFVVRSYAVRPSAACPKGKDILFLSYLLVSNTTVFGECL
jgi:hypothetical protein